MKYGKGNNRRTRMIVVAICMALCLLPCSKASRKLLEEDWQVVVLPWYSNSDPATDKPDSSQTNNYSEADVSKDEEAWEKVEFPSGQTTNSSSTLTQEECPYITLRLLVIEIYSIVVWDSDNIIGVQCSSDNKVFPAITFRTSDATERGSNGARYRPNAPIGQITCGETLTCRIGSIDGDNPTSWRILADEGCTFDFRHFTQLSYEEPQSAWTCSKPPVRYTVDCVECSSPDFPWERALEGAGPPLDEEQSSGGTTVNSMLIIIGVGVVCLGIVLAILAVVIRSRRIAAADARMAELVRRSRANQDDLAQGDSSTSSSFKPAEFYEIGEAKTESPPANYKGPVVVINAGQYDVDKSSISRDRNGIFSEEHGDANTLDRENQECSSSSSTRLEPLSNSSSSEQILSSICSSIAIAKPEVSVSKTVEEVHSEESSDIERDASDRRRRQRHSRRSPDTPSV